MKVAILAPIAWRTPPEHYGPWEQMASNLTENLVKLGVDVTLFASADAVTNAKLNAVIELGYETDKTQDAKVLECLHISNLMEHAADFDIIHNHFDFLPLTYSRLVKTPIITTIHGFSSGRIVPVYQKYNDTSHYVSISNADRHPALKYLATVYNGLNVDDFIFTAKAEEYLIFFGRIHPDKGTLEAIQIAKKANKKLIIAGIIQDEGYFFDKIKPELNQQIQFVGAANPSQRNKLLGCATALLHPINFEEPFGLSVIESMLCGTPVIAFNRGSMPELIQNNINGFLVNTVDEAVNALLKIDRIERLVCRESVIENYSALNMANQYLALYHKILNKNH